MGVLGIDVSSYQDTQPSVNGLSFVFAKVTEGLSYVNPKWQTQIQTARDSNLVLGLYHYPHIHNDPVAEADYFLSQFTNEPGYILILDWEAYGQSVTHDQLVSYKNAWISHVKSKCPNNPVIVYMNEDYLNNYDDGNHGDGLWIATAGKPAGSPGVNGWIVHQYSDSPIDSDFANFNSTTDMNNWALSFQPPEDIVTPEDIQAIANEVQNRMTSVPVRDTIAYAVLWYLQKALTDTIPVGLQGGWPTLLPQLVAALQKYAPLTEAQVQEALTTVAVNATVTVNGTVK